MMTEISAGAEETAAPSFAPVLGQLDTETGGADADVAAGRATPATPAERRMTGDTGPGSVASGSTVSGDAGPGSASPRNAACATAPATEATGAFSSDHVVPTMADAAEETIASDTAGSAGTIKRAAVPETASEKNMPISPPTGARTRGYKTGRVVDYRKRLEDLDIQILKIREEGTDSNVYLIRTLAETELKLWERELNSIYNALMKMLSQKNGAKLASKQQEWLGNRDARAAENSGRNNESMRGISYVVALVNLTRDRAYGLVGRYKETNGVLYGDEDSSQTALPQQTKT